MGTPESKIEVGSGPAGNAGKCSRSPIIGLLGATVLDRQAYCGLLKHALGIEVAVEAGFAPTAVWAALRVKPEVMLVDADGGCAAAVDAVQLVTRLCPGTRILVLGAAADALHVNPWKRRGIHGYFVKDAGLDELGAAVEALREGRSYFPVEVRRALKGANVETLAGAGQLSRRETELLPLLARGLTLREAARTMVVSYKTADSYRTSLLRKLGVRDRVELARYAIRERIVEP
jgi:DNA-binding NarL/FixJ family response regulator